MAWNRCGLGRAVAYVGQKVRPRWSGEKKLRTYCPLGARCGTQLLEILRSDCGAGVSPETAKPRHDRVPRERGCQGESGNSSVQKEQETAGSVLKDVEGNG